MLPNETVREIERALIERQKEEFRPTGDPEEDRKRKSDFLFRRDMVVHTTLNDPRINQASKIKTERLWYKVAVEVLEPLDASLNAHLWTKKPPTYPAWLDWVLGHKALTALVIVLLTLVPVLPKYELVDSNGRDIQFYKHQVCGQIISRHKQASTEATASADACSYAIEEMFNVQFAASGFSTDEFPLIPGLFYRKKVYRFEFSRSDYNEKYRSYYTMALTTIRKYEQLFGARKD